MSTQYPWDTFFKEKSIQVFQAGKNIYDIGEGLRARPNSGSRFDEGRIWLQEYIAKVDYKVIDPVPDYKPDIVGDIHELPLNDNSVDGIFCLAVLEHVHNPFKAMDEMYRVLRPGGRLLIYVPFLYYYHAHQGYYKDYWRYTHDGLEELAKPFARFEMQSVRGRFETLVRLSPLGRLKIWINFARVVDRIFPKPSSRQVSGYYLYLEK